MTENSNMNIIDDNTGEDISDLENSKSHMLALFATLGKKETHLKNENQKLKVELNESQKKNERLLQEIEKVQGEKQTLQKNLENEKEQKDTQIDSLRLELTELKQAVQSFLSGNLTLKSMSNLVSATPEIVPKQSESVQRSEISLSNVGDEQINGVMPDHQAVQTSDGQFPNFPQSAVQEQPMEVTQLVRSQHDVQSSPKNTSIEGSLSEILVTSGTSGVKSSLATPRKVGDAVQTPDDQLQTTSAEPEQQQQPMEVTQLETKLKIHSGVLFDDGSNDYIKEDNIDGVDLNLSYDDFATKKSFEKHDVSVHEEKSINVPNVMLPLVLRCLS
jgi:hypothetical protein